jgi:hypothetical protein
VADQTSRPNLQHFMDFIKSKRLSTNTPSAIFSSVLSQVSVPSSFAVARRSTSTSSSSSSSSSGGSSAGKALLGTVGVALACSLTSNPSACLAGAADAVTGNSSSSSYGSSSNRTLKSGTWIKSGNTWIGPGGEAIFDNGRVIQGTDGSLCHRSRNALICQ